MQSENVFDVGFFDLWEDNIAIISPDGTITYTNESWKRFVEKSNLDSND